MISAQRASACLSTEFSLVSAISDEFSGDTLPGSSSGDTNQLRLAQRASLKSSLAPSKRKTNLLRNELTIDKLNFSKLSGLYGRDREIETLRESLKAMQERKQLVLISGYSGAGKSALGMTLKDPVEQSGGIIVSGKFDINLASDPYSAFAAACGNIVGQILALRTSDAQAFKTIRDSLIDQLGADVSSISCFIPALDDLLDSGDPSRAGGASPATQSESQLMSTDAKSRFNFIFKKFIRVIAKHFQPFVIILDDLQWADCGSLELMELILMDRDNPNLMVVGIYRDNEVTETDVLASTIRDLKAREAHGHFSIQGLSIGNLDFDSVRRLVNDLLSTEDSTTIALAEICHKRTYGNPFFLIQFLSMLHRRRHLEFNFGLMKWRWDVAEIERQTHASDNVVDLLMSKMESLTPYSLYALQTAANLGSSFSHSAMKLVLENWEQSIENDSSQKSESSCNDRLEQALSELEAQGYIVEEEHGIFHFSHDKVQEAASTSIPESEQRTRARTIGTILITKMRPEELENAIFVVATLLNEGLLPKSHEDFIQLADLNLRAAKKAAASSAFEAAAEYARKGISLLGEKSWAEHYQLTLELYTIGTESEGFCGNLETLEKYYHEVDSQKVCPIEDKLRVYTVWFDSIANLGRTEEACQLAIALLRRFDSSFPSGKLLILFHILKNIAFVKRLLKSGQIDEIKNLPRIEDRTRLQLLVILDKLSTHMYTSESPLMPLAVFRNLSWTMKYGLNSFSAPALGTAGIMFAGVLGDLQGGRKLAKSAIELSETQKGLTEGRTLFIVHGFVMHWTESLRDQLKPMLYAYDSALRSGDTETACWAIQNYCLMRFLTGTTLDILSKDTARYTAQMKDLAREKAYRLTIINLQLYINLMGESEEMAVLYGDVISQEEADDWKKSDKFYLSAHNFWECVILTIIGEYEKCAKLTAELGSDVYSKSAPGTFLSYYEAMSKGVSCFAVARQTRNKRYARTGYEVLRRVKGWIEKGNPNVVHIASLLEAEATAYAGKKFVALQKYELSILVAARSGLMLDAALASERFGDYNLEIKETNNAVFHYEAALKYYREAGAHGKANQILEKHSALWAHPSEVVLRSTSE